MKTAILFVFGVVVVGALINLLVDWFNDIEPFDIDEKEGRDD
jgi:hypothetical protein